MVIALRSTLTFKRLLGHSELHRGQDPMVWPSEQTDERAQRKITRYKMGIKSICEQFWLLETGRFYMANG